ncbi:MAG: 2-hydroxymuconate tautomerase family protein [Nitrososphaeria archaeon]|nr:2-hydroxymuconate tautomerase family protein [Nitrososphaeria archaeon]
MPVVQISMWAGRSDEQKKKIIEGVTNVLCDVLGIKPENVTVIIYDVEKKNWGKSGKPSSET